MSPTCTSVAMSRISGTFHSPKLGGITPGQRVTITAQVVHISNHVYQFWIKANGPWTGPNYKSSPTLSFTPTTSTLEMAVYSKTLDEPNDVGSNSGETAVAATTLRNWATQVMSKNPRGVRNSIRGS